MSIPPEERANLGTGYPQLTQEAVDALQAGAEVIITWSGGNGPHRYRIVHDRWGRVCVGNVYQDRLDFVGMERFHTHVWLVRPPTLAAPEPG